MTEKEIKDLLEQPEVIEFLKKNIKLDLWIEECENVYGYDVNAEAHLFDHLLAEADDCI